MPPRELSDASLARLITLWRRMLWLCPDLVDWAKRRELVAWESEARWRELGGTR